MCFTFKKNNKQTKKSVNCFLQDDAIAGIQSLKTSTEMKLSAKTHGTDKRYPRFPIWKPEKTRSSIGHLVGRPTGFTEYSSFAGSPEDEYLG